MGCGTVWWGVVWYGVVKWCELNEGIVNGGRESGPVSSEADGTGSPALLEPPATWANSRSISRLPLSPAPGFKPALECTGCC
jgi:hypothetical protein